jgi:hypothetical protein
VARFTWTVFRGRCRRNLLAGLALVLLACAYGGYAGRMFAVRGSDASAFDASLVRVGAGLVAPPAPVGAFVPQNNRELYLATVISDQTDVLTGLTILLLRLIGAMSVGGVGLVLLTAGATEWEVRSLVEVGGVS